MITDWSEQHEALLPINHKNYNFWWKKNSQVMKVRYNFDLNYNFECDWLIEQSNINLASELVENRSFLNTNKEIVIKLIFINLHLQTDFSIKGEIEISLEYEEPETLIVTIHKAFNIKAGNTLRNTSDAFVNCAISGTSFQYETEVCVWSLKSQLGNFPAIGDFFYDFVLYLLLFTVPS